MSTNIVQSRCRQALVILLLYLIPATTLQAQTGKPNKTTDTSSQFLHLFLIGNSFSQNATKYLPEIAKSQGRKIVIGRAELGGCPLQRHWESVEAAELNPEDPKGKPYNGKSLRMLLSAGTWDVVTIQQYSLISSDVSTYRPYAKKLYDFIRSIQPQAKVVIHQTWAYRSDADGFSKVNGNTAAKDQQEMYKKSREAYHTIAKELNIDIIPTGDAFYLADTDKARGFKRDKTFNYTQPEFSTLPDQTNSLHVGYQWNKEKKFAFDSHHANAAGCYLGGLVWYAFLFGQPASTVTFKPEEVETSFANYLKKKAQEAVKRNNKSLAFVKAQPGL
jgi:hypothetical protein